MHPGRDRVEDPPGPQLGDVKPGRQVQAVPQLRLVSTEEFVGLLVEIGPATIPFPLTPDQADEMGDKIKAEAQKVRDRQCQNVSPATGPDASQVQADTASTIGTPETPMPSDSITVQPGSSSGGSSSASSPCASDASSEACSCRPRPHTTGSNGATILLSR